MTKKMQITDECMLHIKNMSSKSYFPGLTEKKKFWASKSFPPPPI